MIYVSSSCVKADTIGESVKLLAREGYKNIELSGGTKAYPEMEKELLSLKNDLDLNLLCHNYFPPPPVDFVLNLASLNEEINQLSLEHVLRALELSRKIGGEKFAFHAGFLIDIPVNEIGKVITKRTLFDREAAVERFNLNYQLILEKAENVSVYVENNVISASNYISYGHSNPLLLTDTAGLKELKGTPLLDVAHLKVSCQTLGRSFREELHSFAALTDYVHISDNNGEVDSNQGLEEGSQLFEDLTSLDWTGKTVTLEVYSVLEELRKSYDNVLKITGETER